MGNMFVGIRFIFTNLYDLPTLPGINVFDTLNRKQCISTFFTHFAVTHGVQVTIEVPPPPRLNMMNKSRKNMKKVRT